jgi:hypothetical protein
LPKFRGVFKDADPERLPVEQALLIAFALGDFGINVNSYSMNKLLPEKTCPDCDFLEKKFLSQERWRKNLVSRSYALLSLMPGRQVKK